MNTLKQTIEGTGKNSLTMVIRDRLNDIETYIQELHESNAGVKITAINPIYKFDKITAYKLKAEII